MKEEHEISSEHNMTNNMTISERMKKEKARSFSLTGNQHDPHITNHKEDSELLFEPKHADKTVSYGKNSKYQSFAPVNEENNRKRSSTLMMLAESDIHLSKPVIISNLETEQRRGNKNLS
jgi:hypothetical protein